MNAIDVDRTAAPSLDALFRVLVASQNRDAAEDAAGRLVCALGFSFFSYAVPDQPFGIGDRRAACMVLTSYPAAWQALYHRRHYSADDPIIAFGRRTPLPFAWAEADSTDAAQMLDEARGFGIVDGFTVPVHGPAGSLALFSVSGPEGTGGRIDPSCGTFRALLAAAQCTHAKMADMKRTTPSAAVRLSENERLCLVWTTRGKTSWEIAQILDRSRATVEFHIRRAIEKLDASNRVHAAFKAMQLELL